jgi:dienelactone hydrolase
MFTRLLAATALLTTLASCATPNVEPQANSSTQPVKDVELSWERAQVYVPGSFSSQNINDLKLEKPHPVVIYMHGCMGIDPNHDVSWARFIADKGYVVVMPNSMARPGRVPGCDPRASRPTNRFPKRYEYRKQEIEYAQKQLKAVDWWDKKNLFLMGHSEGGQAAAIFRHENFNGIIISGWTCTNRGHPSFNGIFSPRKIPVLAVAHYMDPWFMGTGAQGRCADHAGWGRDFTQVDLPGVGHSTYGSTANVAVSAFLDKHFSK